MPVILQEKFGRSIRLTGERLQHMHVRPEMQSQEARIAETLGEPEMVKKSLYDAQVNLYYRKYVSSPVTSKYLLVIVKIDNGTGFVLTAFYTDKIKQGETVWEK